MGRVIDTKYAVVTAQPTYIPGLAAVYDLAGDMTQLTYPDGRQVAQSFDGAGRLSTVTSGGITYMGGADGNSGISYTPANATQSFGFGNGVSEANLYNNRLQPCHTTVSSPLLGSNPTGGNLLDRASYYSSLSTSPTNCGNEAGNNGNMYSVVDNLNTGWSQGFTYDSLNRLKTAGRSDGGYSNTYNYDSFGNLIVLDNLHTNPFYMIDATTNELLMNPLAPGMLDQYGHQKNTYTYDYDGNMISSGTNNIGSHQYTYNALSQIMSVDGGSTASYAYNGLNERELKTTNSGWTEYVYFNGQPMAEQTSSGVWSDYIYANGEKIAKVDGQGAPIHISGTNCANCGGTASYVELSTGAGHVFQAGDKLYVSQYTVAPAVGGLILLFTDGSSTSGLVAQDQYGQQINCDLMNNEWINRQIDMSAYAGKVLADTLLLDDVCSPAGNFDIFYNDIAIVGQNGSVTSIYTPTPGQVFSMVDSSSWPGPVTNMRAVSEPNSFAPVPDIHYFVDDHLGTAQVELASGGWPVWEGQFTPFGAELPDGTTDMHYKFTGKERDTESGLDNFGARYYASNMGRFMSPDEPMYSGDLGDPQKLNLYSYVGNNPLSRVDPDGHDYHICVDGGTCFNLTDDQYAALYKQQNGQQGINLPSGMGGAITCGGSVCGTASYFEKGLQDATLGPLLAIDGARGAFSAVKGGISLGRSLMEGIGGLFGKTAAEEATATVEDILATAAKGGRSSATEYTKDGGMAQAAKDFKALKGGEPVQAGRVQVKELADGRRAVLRSGSTDGRTTLEFQRAGGAYKSSYIRYNP